MSSPQQLASAQRGFVSSPAGCGKTHLIAEAISSHNTGTELLLTHTHAGVDALRRKLRSKAANSGSYHIDSIAGWALGFARAFPKTAGYEVPPDPQNADWDQIYRGAAQVLKRSAARKIVQFSYSGMYVDEYQDCTTAQHELIVELSRLIPCRVLGDELQAIFAFKGNVPVEWARDVVGHFEALPELTEPWRWKDNPLLGKWLLAVRIQLLKRAAIDLRKLPKGVTWRQLPKSGMDRRNVQKKALQDARVANSETLVGILEWAAQCHALVKTLGPAYSSVEPIDCVELFDGLRRFADLRGADRADAVVAFAALCMTGINQELKTIVGVVRKGWNGTRVYKHQEQLLALLRVAGDDSLQPVRRALELFRKIPGLRVCRRELYFEMGRALEAFCGGGYARIEDAGWFVRNRTRHAGRTLGGRLISRTLLVKGLEFDHSIVLDADTLDAKNLYVAITRGSKSLTILSKAPLLNPVWDKNSQAGRRSKERIG